MIIKMTDEEYFKHNALSNSQMNYFDLSPRHYLLNRIEATIPTPAMTFGSAFHAYILEEESFKEQFIVEPKFDKRTNTGKAEYNNWFESEAHFISPEGKKILKRPITTDMAAHLEPMKAALLEDPFCRELMEQITQTEVAVFWKHPETGVECRGKVDADAPTFLLDLKTCECAQPDVATKKIINDYPRQGPMYLDGYKQNGQRRKDFYFIFIEKTKPYGVSAIKLSRDVVKYGMNMYDSICDDYGRWLNEGSPDIAYPFRLPFGYHTAQLPYYLRDKL